MLNSIAAEAALILILWEGFNVARVPAQLAHLRSIQPASAGANGAASVGRNTRTPCARAAIVRLAALATIHAND